MSREKKKMAFVDLTNFKNWPMGGMLEYEILILQHLVKDFEVDIWGITVDGKINKSILIGGQEYPIHIWGNAVTTRRIIPNYWRGLSILSQRKTFPQNYDVAYAHTGSCLVALNHMVDRKTTKLVYHQHGLNHRADYSLRSLIQRPLLNKAQRVADLVFVVSDPDSVAEFADEMKIKSKARFVAIGSPINLENFNRQQEREKILNREREKTSHFLYTGRLTAFKNAKTMVEAFNQYVKNINSDAVLKIAGTGEEYDVIKKQIDEFGLQKNVILLGGVPHHTVYQLLKEAEVFLTASGGEGVSVSVLEAYAAGLPIVCFQVPGLEKQVIDRKTGIIAKERTAKSFYEAMVKLDSERTMLALNCLEESQKYDSHKIVNVITTEINKLF